MSTRSLSLKMDEGTLARLETESQRAGKSRADFVRTLIEEGLRMQAHPGIVFKPGPVGRRPALANGPDIWEVAGLFDRRTEFSDRELEQLAMLSPVSVWQLRIALRYYKEYQAEIDDWVRRNDEEAERAYAEWLSQQAALPR